MFFCLSWITSAEISIDIIRGINHPCPISIIPFNKIHELNIDDPADIISSDLRNTGKFNTISYSQFPEYPKNISEINPKKWLNIGNNIIVMGKINKKNDIQYEIYYQVLDISSNLITIILQNKYTITSEWIRYAAHTISNDIFEKIIGIPGEFCTKIAYITYLKNRKYPYKLYVSDYDGHNQVLIYQSLEPLMSPTWTPSGDQLVYVLFSKNNSMLVLHNLHTGFIRQIVNFPRHNGAPTFSPDGKKLAFVLSQTGSLNLYVMDIHLNKIRQITNERSNNTEPSWFPDNSTLAYTSDRGGTPQIYKINIHQINSEPQRLSWSNFSNQNGKISSDGKILVMISREDNIQYITKLDLLSEEYQRLTNTMFDETPTLSPNNTMIIYSTSEESSSSKKLYLLSIDGHYRTCLPINEEQIRFPAWSSNIK